MVVIEVHTVADDGEEVRDACVLLVRGRVRPGQAVEGKTLSCAHVVCGGEMRAGRAKVGHRGSFSFLVHLRQGKNVLHLRCGPASKKVQVTFRQRPALRSVRLVYVVYKDHDGSFQAPVSMANDVGYALKRISVVAALTQTLFHHTLRDAGYSNGTFAWTKLRPDGLPAVLVYRSSLTVEEARARSEEALWEQHAKEMVKDGLIDSLAKVLAVTSATEYELKGMARPDHASMLAMTKGHVMLGRAGLALVSSGCLFSWPESLEDAMSSLRDSTRINWKESMDLSWGASTAGGCFAATLGAMVHELGHCFDLGHTLEGVMGDGFRDADVFLGTREDHQNDQISVSTAAANSGSSFLSHYRRRRKMAESGGRFFWADSCAVILAYHKWLKEDHSEDEGPVQVDGTMMVEAQHQIVIAEARDSNGLVLAFEEPNTRQFDCKSLLSTSGASEVFLMTSNGDKLVLNKQ